MKLNPKTAARQNSDHFNCIAKLQYNSIISAILKFLKPVSLERTNVENKYTPFLYQCFLKLFYLMKNIPRQYIKLWTILIRSQLQYQDGTVKYHKDKICAYMAVSQYVLWQLMIRLFKGYSTEPSEYFLYNYFWKTNQDCCNWLQYFMSISNQNNTFFVLMFYPCGIIMVCLYMHIENQGKGLVSKFSTFRLEKIL